MKLRITVHGVAYEVDVEVLDAGDGFRTFPQPLPQMQRHDHPGGGEAAKLSAPLPGGTMSPASVTGSGGAIHSPIAGNVLAIKCKAGDIVTKDQILLVIEAMKMETSIAAPTAGTIKSVDVAVGDVVRENHILVTFQ